MTFNNNNNKKTDLGGRKKAKRKRGGWFSAFSSVITSVQMSIQTKFIQKGTDCCFLCDTEVN